MDFNKTLSEFQFKASKVKNIEIKNDFSFLPNNDELNTSINITNGVSDINKREDNLLYANLQLNIQVTVEHKTSSKKLFINLTVDGLFTFSKDDKAEFNKMLLLNGNSTLYSIARAQIINLSSMCLSSGEIILPMVNFLKLLQLKEAEDNEKK